MVGGHQDQDQDQDKRVVKASESERIEDAVPSNVMPQDHTLVLKEEVDSVKDTMEGAPFQDMSQGVAVVHEIMSNVLSEKQRNGTHKETSSKSVKFASQKFESPWKGEERRLGEGDPTRRLGEGDPTGSKMPGGRMSVLPAEVPQWYQEKVAREFTSPLPHKNESLASTKIKDVHKVVIGSRGPRTVVVRDARTASRTGSERSEPTRPKDESWKAIAIFTNLNHVI